MTRGMDRRRKRLKELAAATEVHTRFVILADGEDVNANLAKQGITRGSGDTIYVMQLDPEPMRR